MKKLIALILIFASPALAEHTLSHAQIVDAIQHQKVGKSPQHGKGMNHYKAQKLKDVMPPGKRKNKKHHHKKSYAKGSSK